jgi:hypothetical protein
MYPTITPTANKAAYVALSGAGVSQNASPSDFAALLSLSGTNSVQITATVVDIAGNTVSPQPSLTATSSNGAQQSGGSSENTAYPQPNGAGSQEEINGPHCDFSPSGYNIQPYIAGQYPSSEVATVSAVISGVATVTAQNIGSALIEWLTQSGATGRLTVQVTQ